MLVLDSEHEPLHSVEWSVDAARDGVAEIAAEACAVGANDPWRMHPDDVADGERNPARASCLYFGAAGVLLALDWLARHAGTTSMPNSAERTREVRELHAREPELAASHPSWFVGSSGVEAVDWLLGEGDVATVADHLTRAI